MGPFCILIVEDEAPIRDELRRCLDRELPGGELSLPKRVTDACDLLTRCSAPYNVILLDLKLPEVQGSEPEFNEALFRMIRDRVLSRVVIHTTGYPNDPQITNFILHRAFRQASGPRSVFLPRMDDTWAKDVVEVVRQAVAHPPPVLVQVKPPPSRYCQLRARR